MPSSKLCACSSWRILALPLPRFDRPMPHSGEGRQSIRNLRETLNDKNRISLRHLTVFSIR
jgi:hypothetical protein